MSHMLNFLTFGAGAIGTYIGGSLSLKGHNVVFLERPEVAVNLLGRGLSLNIDQQVHHILSPRIASSLSEAISFGTYDAAIFALKSNHTHSALDLMAPYKDELPTIVCFQNGVENEKLLSSVLGESRVIAGTVTSAIGRNGAGDIVLERKRGVGIAGGNELSQRLVSAFNEAGLNANIFPHAKDMKWSKLLTNLLANASSAILDMTPGEIFSHPGLFYLEVRQLREALRVMSGHHIRVVDLPGVPVRLLALAVTGLPLTLARPAMRKAVGGGRGGKMPSFHIDLHSGKGITEVDYLNGAVVRYGIKAGVPTPVNQLLNETLQAMARGDVSLDEYAHQPEKLLNLFPRIVHP
ncbi:MAG: ketopantoate reductase family protein [Chloroflexi bacterium]|nr:MAG: ketopantoate reductase family protein [Chloroflexota bacterium]